MGVAISEDGFSVLLTWLSLCLQSLVFGNPFRVESNVHWEANHIVGLLLFTFPATIYLLL